MEFNVLGKKVVLKKGIVEYAKIKNTYSKNAQKNTEKYMKEFLQEVKHMDSFGDKFYPFTQGYVIAEVTELLNKMSKKKIYSYDENKILQIFEELNVIESIDTFYHQIMEEYCSIIGVAEAEKEYRQLRKDSRGRWSGGGFTMQGAINGAIKAGAMNVATGVAHSAFNAIGNIGTSIALSSKKSKLYERVKRELPDIIEQFFCDLCFVEIKLNKDNGIKDYIIPSPNDIKECEVLLANLEAKRVDRSDIPEVVNRMINLNPLNLSIYVYLIKNFGDKDGQIQKMVEKLSISLFEIKLGMLDDEYSPKYKKIIDKYAHDDSEDAVINSELEVVALREEYVKKKIDLGVKEKTDFEKDLDEYIDVLYKLNRTVNDVLYPTIEEAKRVKEDYKMLHDFFQEHVRDENLFDEMDNLEFQTDVIDIRVVKKEISSILQDDEGAFEEYKTITSAAIELTFEFDNKEYYNKLNDAQKEFAEHIAMTGYVGQSAINSFFYEINGTRVLRSKCLDGKEIIDKAFDEQVEYLYSKCKHPFTYIYLANYYAKNRVEDAMRFVNYSCYYDLDLAKKIANKIIDAFDDYSVIVDYYEGFLSNILFENERKIENSVEIKEMFSEQRIIGFADKLQVEQCISEIYQMAQEGIDSKIFEDILVVLKRKYNEYCKKDEIRRNKIVSTCEKDYFYLLQNLYKNFEQVNWAGVNGYYDFFEEKYSVVAEKLKEADKYDESEMPLIFIEPTRRDGLELIWFTNRNIISFSLDGTLNIFSLEDVTGIYSFPREKNIYMRYPHDYVNGHRKIAYRYNTEELSKIEGWIITTIRMIQGYNVELEEKNIVLYNDVAENKLERIRNKCIEFRNRYRGYSHNGEQLKRELQINKYDQLYISTDKTLFKTGEIGFIITNFGLLYRKRNEPVYFVPYVKLSEKEKVILIEIAKISGTKQGSDLENLMDEIIKIVNE